jgi:hypothetical protein
MNSFIIFEELFSKDIVLHNVFKRVQHYWDFVNLWNNVKVALTFIILHNLIFIFKFKLLFIVIFHYLIFLFYFWLFHFFNNLKFTFLFLLYLSCFFSNRIFILIFFFSIFLYIFRKLFGLLSLHQKLTIIFITALIYILHIFDFLLNLIYFVIFRLITL